MTDRPPFRPICAECTEHDEDPAPWCDCQHGDQCRGPCKQRAHKPERCPFLSAMVPHPAPWHLVKPGDTIRQRDGALVHVTAVENDGRTWWINYTNRLAQLTISTADPDRPVPVLTPYAERAALLTLRENGLRPTVLDRPAGGAG